MPTAQELIGILVVIAVIWIVLKVAKVAIKLILFIITLLFEQRFDICRLE